MKEEDRRARLWASLVMVAKEMDEKEKEAERGDADVRMAAATLMRLREDCERQEKQKKERQEREERQKKEHQERDRRARRLLKEKALKKPIETTHLRHPCKSHSSSSSLINRFGKRTVFQQGQSSASPPKKPKTISPRVRRQIVAPDPRAVVMPEELRRYIQHSGGAEPMLVIDKPLTHTDVSSGQGRLSLPIGKLASERFLTLQEQLFLSHRTQHGAPSEISVPLLQQWGSDRLITTVKLKRWDMKKETGKISSTYVLCHTWNSIVSGNHLRAGQQIQIWSFRLGPVLYLAMTRIPRS